MANIRVDVNYTIKDGSEIVFRSPVDCSQVTGLKVYYPKEDGNTTSKEFALADAHGENVGDIDHLFAENVVVKVILDVTSGMAFVQNADTNAYLEARFASLEEAIGTGVSGGDGVPSYVKSEVERLAAVVQERQTANTMTFLACSDPHYSTVHTHAAQMTASLTHMGQAMGMLRDILNIDFATYLGDTVYNAGETNAQALSAMRFVSGCLADGFRGIPNFRMRGNYENLAKESGPTDAQIFTNIGIHNRGMMFNPDNWESGYGYRDFEYWKTRVVLINTNESHNAQFTVSTEQCEWLAAALDVSDFGDGWHTILLSHHPLDWSGSSSNIMQTIKAASGILCAFHGHVHGYKVDKITGTNIPRIAIPNACYYRNNEYGTNGKPENNEGIEFGETTTYHKTANSANDTAFCVITIDFENNRVYADHYGAGYDRVVALDGTDIQSYTVTNNLTYVTSDNTSGYVNAGASYTANLSAYEGYEISSIVVTMGGTPVSTGANISIPNVTGDIVITATATVAQGGEDEEEETYTGTNLVPAATVVNGTAIFNGTGYKDGQRISGAISTSAVSGYVTTGVMPYTENTDGTHKTIYIRGAELNLNDSNCRWTGICSTTNATANNSIQLNGGASAGSAYMFSTYFTIDELATNYYKLTPIESGFDSHPHATVGFMMSLKGSGSKLIITLDEPIEPIE